MLAGYKAHARDVLSVFCEDVGLMNFKCILKKVPLSSSIVSSMRTAANVHR